VWSWCVTTLCHHSPSSDPAAAQNRVRPFLVSTFQGYHPSEPLSHKSSPLSPLTSLSQSQAQLLVVLPVLVVPPRLGLQLAVLGCSAPGGGRGRTGVRRCAARRLHH
jgi:hypothetical protein